VKPLPEPVRAHCDAKGIARPECRKQFREKCEGKGLTPEQCKRRLEAVTAAKPPRR
jgi:hypothetical protein